MKRNEIFTLIVLIGLFSNGIFVSNAFAYLDPGTGTVILQALVGVLVGVGITIKVYWHRIREKFRKY
tara:strand:- start:6033 stop:6233 length:201 start_codon:yes stop_codon:yes gene_type:complete